MGLRIIEQALLSSMSGPSAVANRFSDCHPDGRRGKFLGASLFPKVVMIRVRNRSIRNAAVGRSPRIIASCIAGV